MLIIFTVLFAVTACVLGVVAMKKYVSLLIFTKILLDHNIEPTDAELKEVADYVAKELIEDILHKSQD